MHVPQAWLGRSASQQKGQSSPALVGSIIVLCSTHQVAPCQSWRLRDDKVSNSHDERQHECCESEDDDPIWKTTFYQETHPHSGPTMLRSRRSTFLS